MPVYTYRREDGTTFDYRQNFSDDALTTDPATGQKVVRVVQPARVIFKGSGFYVTDTRGAASSTSKSPQESNAAKSAEHSESAGAKSAETKSESAPAKSESTAAAD